MGHGGVADLESELLEPYDGEPAPDHYGTHDDGYDQKRQKRSYGNEASDSGLAFLIEVARSGSELLIEATAHLADPDQLDKRRRKGTLHTFGDRGPLANFTRHPFRQHANLTIGHDSRCSVQ